jgi:hypothetical protein
MQAAMIALSSAVYCVAPSDNVWIMTVSDEYLTAAEVASILKVHPNTVVSRFEGRPGVIDLGSPEGRFKRRYRVLRIPRAALEKFILEKNRR